MATPKSNVKAEESFDEYWDSSNQKNVEKYYCLGIVFFFFLFYLKPRNGGQSREFCSTAENFGICTQTVKHKHFLARQRTLCGTQDFQEELLRAAELKLQTARPAEMSREWMLSAATELNKCMASSEGKLGVRTVRCAGGSFITRQ